MPRFDEDRLHCCLLSDFLSADRERVKTFKHLAKIYNSQGTRRLNCQTERQKYKDNTNKESAWKSPRAYL